MEICLFTKNGSQKDNLFQYHRNMVIYPSLNPKTKSDFVYTLRSALLVPLYFHFAGSRAGLLMPIIWYVYIYIFRWWLDTAGSVSPKGRLRLDGVCCDWAFALLCYCRINLSLETCLWMLIEYINKESSVRIDRVTLVESTFWFGAYKFHIVVNCVKWFGEWSYGLEMAHITYK